MAERGGGERGGFDRGFGGGRPKETGDTMEGAWPVARRRRRSGSQSRSLDVSSNPTRLSLWSRSTSIPSQSRSTKSSTSSTLASRTRSKSCPFKSKPMPISVPVSRPSLSSMMVMATLDLASRAARKSPPPFVVLSFWLSWLWSLWGEVTGGTRLGSPKNSIVSTVFGFCFLFFCF